jgi:zinc D-Ala-D-Ala carboxypeptidase
MNYLFYFFLVLSLILGGLSAYLYLELTELQATHQSLGATLDNERQERKIEYASSTEAIAIREATIAELADNLNLTSEELEETEDRLRNEKDRNDEFENRIDDIAGTVKDLDKLSKTDKELLQKYSKVYFLNEHYIPESLKEIGADWKYSEDKDNQLHSKVMPFFEEMVEDAKEDGIDLWVVSAFRSFNQQAQLKGAYTQTYGSGANAFSADQGFSEHQLGTTIDFTTGGINGGLEGFGATPAYTWLQENAHKYGFVLSYPENNGYYIYEPWHWRFVGEELAKDLNKAEAHFYDWDQREIDKYLISIFD